MAMHFPPHWKDMKIDSPITKISPIDTSIISFKDPATELIFEIKTKAKIY
jgi:hypothetical protein